MESQDLDWMQKTYYKDYPEDNVRLSPIDSQKIETQNQKSPPPLTSIVGTYKEQIQNNKSNKRNINKKKLLPAASQVPSTSKACDTQKSENLFNLDIQDLDFQGDVTCTFDAGPKEFVLVDPGRISRADYHKSWTMSQKHFAPPPLNLIEDRCKEIIPLSNISKVYINKQKTVPPTENVPSMTYASTTSTTHTRHLDNNHSTTTPNKIIVTNADTESSPCCCHGDIKKMNVKLDQLTYLVRDLSRRILHENSGRSNSTVNKEMQELFPLNSIKGLEELEARCSSKEFREQLINYLTTFVNLGKGLSLAFQKTVADSLALQLNFAGTQKKIAFNKYKRLNAVIFEAWKSPLDSLESFQCKLKIEFRKSHNRENNKKLRLK